MAAAEPTAPPRWELAAENIAVKIRWFGLFLGYLYVNTSAEGPGRLTLNATDPEEFLLAIRDARVAGVD